MKLSTKRKDMASGYYKDDMDIDRDWEKRWIC